MYKAINLKGKKYISAKRASEITGYTSDYVGQLCRGKKIDAKLIGHSWYVSEKEIFGHKKIRKNKTPKTLSVIEKKGKLKTKNKTLKRAIKIVEPVVFKQKYNTGKIVYFKDESPLFPIVVKKFNKDGAKYTILKSLEGYLTKPIKFSPIEKFVINSTVVSIILLLAFNFVFEKEKISQSISSDIGDNARQELSFIYGPYVNNVGANLGKFKESVSVAHQNGSQLASSVFSVDGWHSFSGWVKDTAYTILKPWLEDEKVLVEKDNNLYNSSQPSLATQLRQGSAGQAREGEEITTAQAKMVFVAGADREYVDMKIAELKNWFMISPLAPNVNRYYITKQNDSIVTNINSSVSNVSDDLADFQTSIANSFSTNNLNVTGSTTVTDLTATEWLTVGTTTRQDILTLDGAFYLASINAPTDTSSRLYNTSGDLYWNGNLIGGSAVGNWTTDGTNIWRAGGNVSFLYSSSTQYSSFATASTTNLIINGQSFNNLLGTGLQNIDGALTLSTTTLNLTTSAFASNNISQWNNDAGFLTSATGLSSYDAWTHPAAGQSATTSLLVLNGNATTTGLTVIGSTYLATAGGNVGIGTTSPSQLLTVGNNNQFTVDSSGNVVGNTLFTGTSAGGSMTVDVSENGGRIQLGSGVAPTNNFTISRTNNVVSGDYSVSTAKNFFITPADGYNSAFTSGNVGIGTTSPYANLSVVGDGVFTRNLNTANFTATGTATFTSLSQGIAYIGSNNLLNTVASSSIFGFTPASNAVTLTINGTGYDLSTNRSWTITDNTASTTLLSDSNTWTKLQNFTNASSTLFSSTYASTTNLYAGMISLNGTDLQTTLNAKQGSISTTWPITLTGATVGFSGLGTSTTPVIGNIPYFSGANTFANIATGTISVPTGLSITANRYALGGNADITLASGYVIPQQTTLNTYINSISTSTNETAGGLSYWTTTSGSPAKLGSVATTTLTASGALSLSQPISVLGSSASSLTCATANASTFGCLAAADFSKFNSATTTFSTGLTYTLGTNAVTVNPSQNITTLSNLTANGFVYTAGSNGTLAVAASSSIFGFTPISNSLTKGYTIVGSDDGVAQATSSIFVSSTGNIGIGTTGPAAPLDVNGKIYSRTGGIYADNFLSYSGASQLTVQASDNLALYTNGSEKVRIQSDGNIGIGTTSPQALLHISGTSGMSIIETTGNNSSILDIRANGTGDSKVYFDLNGASPFAMGVDNSDDDKFKISGNYQLGTNDRFVIDSTGNVGVGTSSPSQKLDVWGNLNVATSSTSALFVNTATSQVGIGTGTPGGSLQIWTPRFNNQSDTPQSYTTANGDGLFFNSYYLGSGNSYIRTSDIVSNSGDTTGSQIRLFTKTANQNVAERVRIDTSGNVGIGTTSPFAKLSVESTAGATQFVIGSSTATSFIVDKNGNVGIGTANPAYKLDVVGSDNTEVIAERLWNSASSANQLVTLRFENGNSGSSWNTAAIKSKLYSGGNNGDLEFYTLNTGVLGQRMTIDNTGNVGIGSTTPGYKLSVAGSGFFDGGTVTAANLIATSSFSTPSLTLSGTAINSLLSTNASGAIVATSTPTFGFFNATSTAATSTIAGGLAIETSGFVYDYSTNNVGIGTAGPAYKLDVNGTSHFGGQSTFSDTGFFRSDSGASPILQFWGQGGYRTSLQQGANGAAFTITSVDGAPMALMSGNVGIGTTSPWARLSVTGSGTGTEQGFVFADSNNAPKVSILNNGNVGIGITAPTSKLYVSGSLRVTSSASFDNIIRGAATGAGTLDLDYGGTADRIDFGFTDTSALVTIKDSGNVGIGTTSPAATLQVNGSFAAGGTFTPIDPIDIRSSGSLALGQGTAYGNVLTGSSANTILKGPAVYFQVPNGTNVAGITSTGFGVGNISPSYVLDVVPASGVGTDLFRVASSTGTTGIVVKNNGNVGIGTTSPFAKLSVESTAGATQFVIGSSTATSFIVDKDGNVGIGTTSPTAKLNINGNVELKAGTTHVNVGYYTIDPGSGYGKVRFGSNTANADLSSNLYYSAGAWNSDDATNGSGLLRVRPWSMQLYTAAPGAPTSLSQIMYITNYPTAQSYINTNGAFGIGTTSSFTTLQISSTTASATFKPQLAISDFSAGANLKHWTLSSQGGNFYIASATDAYATTTGISALSILNNGNVGIGTTGPGDKLEVAGNVLLSGANNRLYHTGTGVFDIYNAVSGASLDLQSNGGSVYVGKYSDDSTLFSVRDSDGQIYMSGNVGIGTTGPGYTLDVVGNFRSTTAGENRLQSGTTYMFTQIPVAGAGGYGQLGVYDSGLGNMPLALQPGGGNVGIGTTSPTARLHVVNSSAGLQAIFGDTTQDSSIQMAKSSNGARYLNVLQLGSTFTIGPTDGSIVKTEILGGGTTGIDILNNGNVGIGTTSPAYKLDIAGSLSLDNNNYFRIRTAGGVSSRVLGLDTNNDVYIGNVDDTGGSLYLRTSGTNIVKLDNSSAVANSMTIKSGNVGIGTTSPASVLQVIGDPLFSSTNYGAGLAGNLQFVQYPGSPVSSRMTFGTDGTGWQFRIAKNQGGSVSDLVTIQDNGNVGIGTTGPGSLLHINSGAAASAQQQFSVNNAYNSYIAVAGGANNFFTGTVAGDYVLRAADNQKLHLGVDNGAGNNSPGVTIQESGNVGIGTTSPDTALHVVGAINLQHTSVLDSNVRLLGLTWGATGDSILDFQTQVSSAEPTTEMRLFPGGGLAVGSGFVGTDPGNDNVIIEGNVGIGTTTPGYKLSVAGSAYFDGGTVTAANLIATSSFSTPSLTLSGTAINSLLSTNASGAIVATSTPTFGFFNATSTAATSTIAGGLAIETSGFVYDYSTNNVGIGTAGPSEKLTVSGGNVLLDNNQVIKWKDASGNSQTVLGVFGANQVNLYGAGQNINIAASYGGATLASFAPAGDITFSPGGTYSMTLKTTSGNVGIGTTSPSAKLHVYGTGAALLQLETTGASGASNSSGLRLIGGASNADWFIGTNRGDVFANGDTFGIYKNFGTSGAKLVIQDNGNVGIGTTSPTAKLTINGPTAYYASEIGNFHIENSLDTNKKLILGFDTSLGTYGSSYIQSSYTGTAQLPLLLNPLGGNVGIGTTGPLSPLQVSASNGEQLIFAPSGASFTSNLYNSGGWKYAKTGYGTYTGLNEALVGDIAFYTAPSGIAGNAVTFNPIGMIIKNNGNVGIGTTGPLSKLSIGTAGAGETFGIMGQYAGINTSAIVGTFNVGPGYQSNSWANMAYTSYVQSWDGTYTDSDIRFFTANGGVGTGERMRIDTNGNVGIGTTLPNYKLEVDGTSDFGDTMTFSNATRGTITWGNGTINSGAVFSIVADTDQYLSLGSNNVDGRLVMDTSGNVGIGTTSPSQKLHVSGASAKSFIDTTNTVGSALILGGSGTFDGRNWYVVSNGSSDGASAGSFSLYDATAAANRLVINTSGNVGIGTTSPGAKLQIHSTTASDEVIRLSDSTADANANKYINWYSLNTPNNFSFARIGAGYGSSYANPFMAFSVADSANALQERMRIDKNGNVGIGTTGPGVKLSVQTATTNSTVVTGLRVFNPGAGSGTGASLDLSFSDSATTQSRISGFYDGTGMVTTFGNSPTLGGAVSEYMRIDRSGNVGIGTTSPWGLLSVNANGLTSGTPQFVVGSSTATNFIVANNGNVGVGTVSPGRTLEVAGIIQGNNQIISKFSTPSFYWDDNVEQDWEMKTGDGNMHLFGAGEYLTVLNTSGNVGIGTTTPDTSLTIKGSSNQIRFYSDSTSPAGQTGTISFSSAGSNSFDIKTDYVASGNKITLTPGGSTAMTLLGSGNVGIGTTTPGDKLSVLGAISVNTGSSGEFIFRDANTIFKGSLGYNATSDYLELKAGGNSTKMVVDSSGNVGIGTTSPNSKLEVVGASDNDILIVRNSADNGFLDLAYDSTNDRGRIRAINSGGGGQPVYINESLYTQYQGNVGIGTTGPASNLHLYENNTSVVGKELLRLDNPSTNATNNGQSIGFYQGATQYGKIATRYSTATGGWQMYLGASNFWDTLTLSKTGNVGIGTTSPDTLLTLRSASSPTITLSDGTYTDTIKLNSSSQGALQFIGPGATQSLNVGGSGGSYFYSNGSETASAFSVKTTGDYTTRFTVLDNGNVGIGTTSPTDFKLQVAGNIGPDADNTYTLGANGKAFSQVYATNFYTSNYFTYPGNSQTSIIAPSGGSINFKATTGSYPTVMWVGDNGNVGIGTTTPLARLNVYGGNTVFHTNSNSATAFSILNAATTSIFSVATDGFGTTTLAGLNIVGQATSTSNVGFNITSGCYAVNGVCVGGGSGSGTVNAGVFGQLAFFGANGTALSGTSTITVSTTTASGRVGINTSTNLNATLTLQGAAGLDILNVATSTSGSILTISSWGGFVQKISSTTALSIQMASGTPVFEVDTTQSDSNAGIDITAATGQTANLLNFYSSAGSFLSGFTSAGGLYMNLASSTALSLFDGSNNAAFIVNSTGKSVGVGTSTLTYNLNVEGSQAASYIARINNSDTGTDADGLLISLGVANASRATTNYFIGFSDGAQTVAGKIQGGANAVAYTTTSADIAEYFRVSNLGDAPVAGEIVVLDRSKERSVVKAYGASDTGEPLGIVSTNPGFIGNGPICFVDDEDCDREYQKYNVLVSLAGQVPLKVSLENGPIAVGDYLTLSSTTPGAATKLTGSGYVVGTAITALDQSSTSTEVTVLIKSGWREAEAGKLTMNDEGLAIPGIWKSLFGFFKQIGLEFSQNFIKIANLVTNKITSQKVETKELCIEDVCVNKDQLAALLTASGISTSTSTPTSTPIVSDTNDGGAITTPATSTPIVVEETSTSTPPVVEEQVASSTEPVIQEPVVEPVPEPTPETTVEPVTEPTPEPAPAPAPAEESAPEQVATETVSVSTP